MSGSFCLRGPANNSRVNEFFQDARFGLRILFKSPGFALVALATIGIGANAATFSVVDRAIRVNPIVALRCERGRPARPLRTRYFFASGFRVAAWARKSCQAPMSM